MNVRADHAYRLDFIGNKTRLMTIYLSCFRALFINKKLVNLGLDGESGLSCNSKVHLIDAGSDVILQTLVTS